MLLHFCKVYSQVGHSQEQAKEHAPGLSIQTLILLSSDLPEMELASSQRDPHRTSVIKVIKFL